MSDKFEVTVTRLIFINGGTPKIGSKINVTEEEFNDYSMAKGDYELPAPIDNSGVKRAEDIEHEPLEIPSLLNKEDKPKRKRRTPEEMKAARAEEAKKEK